MNCGVTALCTTSCNWKGRGMNLLRAELEHSEGILNTLLEGGFSAFLKLLCLLYRNSFLLSDYVVVACYGWVDIRTSWRIKL